MAIINEQYAKSANLNDLYYTACIAYTSYIQTGNKELKEVSMQYTHREGERRRS